MSSGICGCIFKDIFKPNTFSYVEIHTAMGRILYFKYILYVRRK